MNLFTEFKEGLMISWGAIRANRMRSILTTLGIVIGIVTVTLMGTAIEGLNRSFLKSISVIGADVLYVNRFNWLARTHQEWMKMQKRKPITLNQVKDLERELSAFRAFAPTADTDCDIKAGRIRSGSVRVIGTTEQFIDTSGFTLAAGRFFSPTEVEGGRPVCVIGSEVASKLFGRGAAVGERVSIDSQPFEVVGVLEKQGSFMGQMSLDNQAIVPLRQFMNSFWSNPDFSIQIKVNNVAELDETREEVRAAFRRVRKVGPGEDDDFSINQQDQFLEMFHQIAGTIAAVGLFITGLSLFVGGIGIMNIMFVSVTERTREIGIRKAIGAKQRTILIQFLVEAAGLCLLGGLIGLGLAWPLTLILSRMVPAQLSLTVASIAIAVSLITGVLSGFFPAWRAARMKPVDALRTGD